MQIPPKGINKKATNAIASINDGDPLYMLWFNKSFQAHTVPAGNKKIVLSNQFTGKFVLNQKSRLPVTNNSNVFKF